MADDGVWFQTFYVGNIRVLAHIMTEGRRSLVFARTRTVRFWFERIDSLRTTKLNFLGCAS
jgi:hypothetical protein